jgi:hypothetical protein
MTLHSLLNKLSLLRKIVYNGLKAVIIRKRSVYLETYQAFFPNVGKLSHLPFARSYC